MNGASEGKQVDDYLESCIATTSGSTSLNDKYEHMRVSWSLIIFEQESNKDLLEVMIVRTLKHEHLE